jgi:hypothetical protein
MKSVSYICKRLPEAVDQHFRGKEAAVGDAVSGGRFGIIKEQRP